MTYPVKTLKIAILGPESSGKTTLATALAAHFGSVWVAEYAREYVENLNRPYTFDDVCSIAREEILQENARYNSSPVFFDTDLIITKIWLDVCYNNIPPFVEQHLQRGVMDFYLLCTPDLAWYPEAVRENGSDSARASLFERYKAEIQQLKKPFAVVTGTGKKRLNCALKAIENLSP